MAIQGIQASSASNSIDQANQLLQHIPLLKNPIQITIENKTPTKTITKTVCVYYGKDPSSSQLAVLASNEPIPRYLATKK